MEWNKNNITNIVQFINDELNKGRTMVDIEKKEFEVNERVIHKRLVRLGYKKVNNQYITSSITNVKVTETKYITSNITQKNNDIMQKQNKKTDLIQLGEYDMDKLKLLLDNIDILLKLIPNSSNITSNIDSLRSGLNTVISLRADTGLYNAVKERAARDKVNIVDIVNKALEDYLQRYL